MRTGGSPGVYILHVKNFSTLYRMNQTTLFKGSFIFHPRTELPIDSRIKILKRAISDHPVWK